MCWELLLLRPWSAQLQVPVCWELLLLCPQSEQQHLPAACERICFSMPEPAGASAVRVSAATVPQRPTPRHPKVVEFRGAAELNAGVGPNKYQCTRRSRIPTAAHIVAAQGGFWLHCIACGGRLKLAAGFSLQPGTCLHQVALVWAHASRCVGTSCGDELQRTQGQRARRLQSRAPTNSQNKAPE